MNDQSITKNTRATDTVEKVDAEAVNSKEARSLYVARKKIHPKRTSGFFRNLKWVIMAITLGIYYITPFIRWDRGEFAPDQAVLIDMASRRFYFFMIQIWPQEFFYVAGMLVMAGIALFLVTSTVGRAWCGYACPQTVWVDLFLVVERFFEGDRNKRIKLDEAPWNAEKISKRVGKHTVWLLISIATGGAWIFYFADAPTLFVDFFTLQAPFVAYATVGILTATTYIFGGLMREQVCTYMCPWPRIQAAMLDENSLTVTYNDWRGEPRSRHAKKMKREGVPVGDCVDCNACVAVCPMGIDIRDGQQLECITCALCIDACDSVMDKLGIERGLIAYATLGEYQSNMALAATGVPANTAMERAAVPNYASTDLNPRNIRDENGKLSDKIFHTTWRSIVRPRTIMYAAIYAAIGFALLAVLATRDRLDLNVIPDRNPQFVQLSDGSIRNGYEVKILNMVPAPRQFRLSIKGMPDARMKLVGSDLNPRDQTLIDVKPDQLKSIKVYVTLPREHVALNRMKFIFNVHEIEGYEFAEYEANFETPGVPGP